MYWVNFLLCNCLENALTILILFSNFSTHFAEIYQSKNPQASRAFSPQDPTLLKIPFPHYRATQALKHHLNQAGKNPLFHLDMKDKPHLQNQPVRMIRHASQGQ